MVLAYEHGYFAPDFLAVAWTTLPGQECRLQGRVIPPEGRSFILAIEFLSAFAAKSGHKRSLGPDLRPNEEPPVCVLFHRPTMTPQGSIWGSRCNRSLPSRALRVCRSLKVAQEQSTY
ncbi:hypothetical protein N7450_006251 [Penicillium hetheringtonii]|uniref:Uncharacterized protein n=1 Tax=Penicillium hetheringtonii TaxID=911720 RepID=A0AAD6GSQ3_9EURO|nr:hypothetical protein N7450_006251 [Penicillium hetheringtonii]